MHPKTEIFSRASDRCKDCGNIYFRNHKCLCFLMDGVPLIEVSVIFSLLELNKLTWSTHGRHGSLIVQREEMLSTGKICIQWIV